MKSQETQGDNTHRPESSPAPAQGLRIPWLVVALGGACVLLGVVLVAITLIRWPRPQPPPSPASVEEALAQGQAALALELIRQLANTRVPDELPLGTFAYWRGLALAKMADDYPGAECRRLLTDAVNELQDALKLGVDESREHQARFALATALYRLGRWKEAQAFLPNADLAVLPPGRRELFALIWADLWAKDRPDEVVRFVDEFLSTTPVDADLRAQLLLRKAWCLARVGKTAEALETCSAVDQSLPHYPRAKLLEGLIHLSTLRQAVQASAGPKAWANQARPPAPPELERTVTALAEAIRRDNLTCRVTPEALYWLGVAYAEAGQTAEAQHQWQRAVNRAGATPPAVAAAWALGELALQAGKTQLALAWFGHALKLAREALPLEGSPVLDWDRWMPGPALEQESLRVYRRLIEDREFSAALELSEDLSGLVDERLRLRLVAEAYRAVGDFLTAPAAGAAVEWEKLPAGTEHQPGGDPLRMGRQFYRRAGLAYLRLAAASFATREYPDYLWSAAECFYRGRSPHGVLRALASYMEDQPVRRRPAALLYRGEALLALGKTEQATADLRSCYEEYPRDAAAPRARLLAARAYRELGQLEEAASLLRRNVDGQDLTPASREWRESLIDLAEILQAQNRWNEADQFLAETLARYPDNPQAGLALYLRAYGKLRSAQVTMAKSREEPLSGLAAEYRTVARNLFREARELFGQLRTAPSDLPAAFSIDNLSTSLGPNVDCGLLFAQIGADEFAEAYATAEELIRQAHTMPEVIPAVVYAAYKLGEEGFTQQAQALGQKLQTLWEGLEGAAATGRMVPELNFWKNLAAVVGGRLLP